MDSASHKHDRDWDPPVRFIGPAQTFGEWMIGLWSLASRKRLYAMALIAILAGILAHSPLYADELTLAVANSTCNAIMEVGERFKEDRGVEINYICKSSGRLAKGLRGESIQADIYISASSTWMDYMVEAGLVEQDRIFSPWGNTLVVAARAGSRLEFSDLEALSDNSVRSILIGDPGTAPFGRYTKETLLNRGLWDRVRHKVTSKRNVTLLAKALADSSDDTVGILFLTNTTDKHRILYNIDPEWHSPILYSVAPISASNNETAVSQFLGFLRSDQAGSIFTKAGFRIQEK